MKDFNFPSFLHNLRNSFLASVCMAALAAACLIIGRDVITPPIIALLFLLPIPWFCIHWGQVSGVASAITATVLFDFYFIPPYGTFNIGSLEGWLILVIFLVVSVVVVGEIQTMLNQARLNEHEAISMFELVASLNTLHSREAIARTLANGIQQDFQARQVTVTFYQQGGDPLLKLTAPEDVDLLVKPSRTWVLESRSDLIGEISIWKGVMPLPNEKSWMLQTFIRQTVLAFDRLAAGQPAA